MKKSRGAMKDMGVMLTSRVFSPYGNMWFLFPPQEVSMMVMSFIAPLDFFVCRHRPLLFTYTFSTMAVTGSLTPGSDITAHSTCALEVTSHMAISAIRDYQRGYIWIPCLQIPRTSTLTPHLDPSFLGTNCDIPYWILCIR